LHRAVWRRLPRTGRRAALFRLMSALAPRPPADVPRRNGPLIVAGFLSSASGLGEGARLCLEALRRGRPETCGIDLSAALMQGPLAVDYQFPEPHRRPGPGTVILHVNPPLVPMALFHLGRRLVAGKRIVGYWAWELPRLPEAWRKDLRYVHEVWVPSAFTASAVRMLTALPVRIVPHPVARRPAADMSCHRPAGVELLVLTMLNFHSGFTRKNPLASVAAFVAAFGGDRGAHLVVKSIAGAAHPAQWRELQAATAGSPNIALIDAVLAPAEISGLIEAADVVLSLHRAEGFGLVAAEAMLRGKPVVATNFSGTVDFLDSRNACPVDYRLVPATDPQGTYDHPDQLWADPDIESAAAALRRLRDPVVRATIGARAAAEAARRFDPAAYAIRAGELLAPGPDRPTEPTAVTTP
jgi:glycosyltransferase involved in cell wall biosynthesis